MASQRSIRFRCPTNLAGSQRADRAASAIPLFDVINIDGTEQISAQAPFELAGQPTVDLVINNGRVQSVSVQLTSSVAQPGIFLPNGVDGAFLHADDSLVIRPSRPARAR